MNKVIHIVAAAALALLLMAGVASAQTPANMTVVSGNGQLICQCTYGYTEFFFRPMVVRVTDADGGARPQHDRQLGRRDRWL